MTKLPPGWVECELKDILEHKKGKKPKVLYNEQNNNFLPYIDIKCFEKRIIENYANQSDGILIDDSYILIVWDGARAGFCGESLDKGILGSTLMALKAINMNKNFVSYFIKSKYQILNKKTKGTGIPHINPEYFWKLKICVPPSNEQKRIVDKIEREFEKIDKGIENLEKVKEQIKQYRQSVLQSAFNGNLYQLRTGWQEFELKDVCKNISAGGDKPKIYSETETELCKIPIYSNGIQNNGLYGYTDVARIVEPAVTVSARGTIGFVCVRKQPYLPIVRLISVIPDTSILNIEFLKYFLNYVVPKGEGSSIPQLTVPNFKKYIITLPSLDEQQKIVEEIEKRFKIADEVEKNIDKNLEKAKQLKQSILKKAFEGRLIPQDPTDEPASKLLERIKQERKINDRK